MRECEEGEKRKGRHRVEEKGEREGEGRGEIDN